MRDNTAQLLLSTLSFVYICLIFLTTLFVPSI